MSYSSDYLSILNKLKKKEEETFNLKPSSSYSTAYTNALKVTPEKRTEYMKTYGNSMPSSIPAFARDVLYGEAYRMSTGSNISPSKLSPATLDKWYMSTYQDYASKHGAFDAPVDAPVKDTTEKEERTWFTSGAFDDGYQLGDVTKTILGTATDAVANLGGGVLEIGEGLIDTAVTLPTLLAEKTGTGNSQIIKGSKEFIAKDTIKGEKIASYLTPTNYILQAMGEDYDDISVLGEKSDSLGQSAGQLAGTIGLQAVGVPWYLTTGVTSFGSGVETGLNEGATLSEAAVSGLINAGADILTEKLFGGSGLGEKGLINVAKLTEGISKKAVKAIFDYGIDITTEGLEEFGAGIISNLGTALYKEENLKEILWSEEAIDGYIEAFIGGAALSGGRNFGKAWKSVSKGTDYRTGLTENEQKVFDKLYNDAREDAKKDNKKLSKNEKSKIHDNIMNNLKKGYIPTDTIEEVLGGESYESYKKALDEETARKEELETVKKEYEELYKMKNIEKSDEQIDRQAMLRQRMDDLTQLNESPTLKKKLTNDVKSQIDTESKRLKDRGSYLAESYNEITRKGQAFKVDLTKYTDDQKAVYERAMNSGVLNDTNRSHEFVDTLARIEAAKGIVFDFTDNAKLKESGFAVEGKTVNGFVKNGSVTLNVQSSKAWQSTVGHEITHVLEGTKAYGELQKALFAYAESKGELNSRRAALTELYKDMDADIDAELTADLVGDYLFSDSDFIKGLTTNKTLFEKVYNEIKYLCKVATGKELSQIEKVKREFDKVWSEASAKGISGKTNYSISADSKGNELSVAVQKRFANSKAVDENGSLKVLYHGTASGEFYTFDKSKGNVEGDFGSGFYFTDNETDVENNYEDGGPDFEIKVERRAEQIQGEEDIDYDEAKKRAREELYKGGNKHTVYLNIENPAIVGETNLFDYDTFAEEYDRNDYDSDEDFESDVEYLIADKIDEIIWDIDRNIDINSTEGISEVLWNAINEGGIDIEQLKANINNLYLEDNNGNLVGNEVTRQIIESLGYDGIIDNTVSSKFNMNLEEGTTHYIVFKPNQIKSIDNQNPTDNPDIRYSISDTVPTNAESTRNYAPTFYSKMGEVIDGVKQEKLGADSVINMLRGKGVKTEEIKWSGIETFLEGKKSVTKAELQEFVAGSMLQLEETVLDGKGKADVELKKVSSKEQEVYVNGKLVDTITRESIFSKSWTFTKYNTTYDDLESVKNHIKGKYKNIPKWDSYTLDGGENYREITFSMPNSTYTNNAMQNHFGKIRGVGILAHARMQDFDVNGKKMLFIEEIQSDWHNEGHKSGYESNINNEEKVEFDELEKTIDALNEQYELLNKEKGTLDIDYFKGEKMSFDEYSNKSVTFIDKLDEIVDKLNYSVNRREELYSKFKNATPDAPFKDNYHEYVLKRLLRMAAEEGYDSIGWTPADVQSKRWSDEFAEGYRIEYDQDIPKFLKKYGKQWGATVGSSVLENGTEVWSMDITDTMKNSVLYEGQALYSLSEQEKKSVDETTLGIMERLNNGEDVSIEEINSTPTISKLLDDAFSRPETYTIDTPERNAKRKEVVDKLLALGSAKVDNDGKVWYNSPVKQEHRADLVIGLSAAGKSSVLVDPLSEYYSSRVIDSDMAKEELAEFDNGIGANAVHRESQDIIKEVLAQSMKNGDNIVYPIVGGGNVNSLINRINYLKNEGYSVYLHLNELPNSKAIGRSLNRYIEKGRFIPPQIIKQYGDTPTQNFNTIISTGGLVDGYSHYSNDVNRNEKPQLIEISENVRQFDERGHTLSGATRENTRTQKTGSTADNEIAPIKETPSDGVFFDAKKHSLSEIGEDIAPVGTPLNELYLAPTKEDIAKMEAPTETVAENTTFDDIAPMPTDADVPPEMETNYYSEPDTTAIDDKVLKNIGKSLRETLYLDAKETKAIQEIVQEYSTTETPNKDKLFDAVKEKFGEKVWREKNEEIADVKRFLRTSKVNVSQKIKSEIADYSNFRKSIGGKLGISKDGLPVDTAYQQLVEMYPDFFSDEIWNETDQFLKMVEVANTDPYMYESYPLDDETIQKAVDIISNEVKGYKQNLTRIAAEETAREALDSIAPPKAEQIANGSRGDALLNQSLDNFPIKTVEDKVKEKIRAVEAELADNRQLRRETESNYNNQIAELTEEYLGLKNNRSKKADNIIRRIARLDRLKASADADYAKRISDLETRLEKMNSEQYTRAMHKQDKMQEHAKWAEDLIGDTSTWKDKKLGIQYEVNTEHRNLRDIIRDADGNKDIARADAINDALNGRYNREEAAKKRELAKIRGKYADFKITKAEDAYIQMLGELRGNPDTELTEKVVNEYYEKHKNKIDKAKVDKVIELARQDYDNLINQVNKKLREQGMKEIPYRQGYFPHFTEPKQNFIQKLLNWKTQDNEIPTSIAGLTEDFKPVKSWQSFDKQRHSDTTDYSFLKGFDNYSEGALDWIHHIDTLQKRRAVENYIRYTHSEEGIKAKIKEVYANEEIDADEAQTQIEGILNEAKNPLNNFVQDFMTHTNILAGKKNSLDRATEQKTNRSIYTTMTNVQNRMSANMVLANVRSALTNFIPITQSWAQVSPLRSLQATKDTIANAIKDDGLINKSTFLTNRLREVDNLYNTTWDKVLDKAGIMFEVIDNFSSQVIWRSKYNQNLANGMTENEAIENADQFAENVMAGRSKGNEPTLFNAKSPFVKAFTMFQLEVNNQYGYFLKDVPNDLKAETNHWKLNLAKGYTTAFIGAYVYNALLEQVAGSGAALDPISIIEDLLKDLGLLGDDDEEEEPTTAFLNFTKNVSEELPFVGGLLGGGRIPISSVVPYSGEGFMGGLESFAEDVSNFKDGGWKNILNEMTNPLLNIGLPVGGGQIKKTVQGLNMFNTDEDHPIAGSYTDSGALRFPVDDTLGNRIQAGIFGQYANENAREYFDNGYAPLKEKQIQEYMDVDLPIADYWKYREGLSGLKKNSEKADYINSLDIADWQKNLLMNNILDRKEDVDMSNYDDYSDFEEFDFAQKNPEKYDFFKANGISYKDYANADEDGKSAYTWAYNNPEKYTLSKAITDDVVKYKQYTGDMYDIKADKDASGKSISGSRKEKVIDYINNLDADYEQKIILFKTEYPSDDTYNEDIINYVNSRNDLTYEERVTIYTELGFTIKDGYVYWD